MQRPLRHVVAAAFAVPCLLAASMAARAQLNGEHRVWYRYTYGQPELQFMESISSSDGSWRMQLYYTVRGPGTSPLREAGLSLWRPIGPLDFGFGAIWYPVDRRWDTWVTAAISWKADVSWPGPLSGVTGSGKETDHGGSG